MKKYLAMWEMFGPPKFSILSNMKTRTTESKGDNYFPGWFGRGSQPLYMRNKVEGLFDKGQSF